MVIIVAFKDAEIFIYKKFILLKIEKSHLILEILTYSKLKSDEFRFLSEGTHVLQELKGFS